MTREQIRQILTDPDSSVAFLFCQMITATGIGCIDDGQQTDDDTHPGQDLAQQSINRPSAGAVHAVGNLR